MAAAGDVSLETSVELSVNSISLNVSGSTATIESIEVGATSFTVSLQSGDAFQVTAGGLNQLSANNATWQSVNTCDGSASVLGYDVESAVTVTITPSDTLCADAAAAVSTSKGDARGGGGGGGSTTVTAPITPVVPVVQITNKAEAIAAIKSQIAVLIQKLIILLTQQIQTMQASGTY